MKKKRLNKVLNIVVTLMAAIALMLGNVTCVAAYTDLNGYPFVLDFMSCQFYATDESYNPSVNGVLQEQNAYLFDFSNIDLPLSGNIRFGDFRQSLIIPYNLDMYDYYVVGTFAFDNVKQEEFPEVQSIVFLSFDNTSDYRYIHIDGNLGLMDFQNYASPTIAGKSFYGKLSSDDLKKSSNLSYMMLNFDHYQFESDYVWFSCSIVPVPKSGSEADTLNSILQTLTQINQNIITGNTLQQQTIDAINQNTTNTSNWFTTLITTMQGWYNTQTENLRTWFYMIEERMSAGFTALYHQMTREQDEKLNGYTDTTQSDAADNFNTESDKLTQLEDQLNDQSHGFVSDYTTTGFNTGVLTTLSSSLIFVTTWFANFWNMGGIFTAGLNLCFSLSIVFFILRLRR